MSQKSRRGLSLAVLHKCDLCSFSSKNGYIFKRHKIRCKKEHDLRENGMVPIDTSQELDSTLDDSVLNDDSALNDSVDDSALNDTVDGDIPGDDDREGNSDVVEAPDPVEVDDDDDDGEDDGETVGNTTSDSIDGLPEKAAAAKRRVYQCPKCEFVTKSSRKFLYHQVETHKAKLNIYTCYHCEYSSRFRHKVLRHMKAAHGVDVSVLQDMEPEYVGQTVQVNRPKNSEGRVKSRPKKMVVSRTSSNKMVVKFGRPTQSTNTGASVLEPLTQKTEQTESVSPALETTTSPPSDQLSRVVKEVIIENGDVMYKCKECTFISDDKQKVAKHAVSWHVDTKSFTCSHCDYISFDRRDFTAHRLTHRNEHQFKCEECSYSTDFRPNYDRHLGNHKGTFPHKCTHCSFGSASETVVRRHTVQNHAPSPETSPKQQSILPPPAKKLKLPVPKPPTTTSSASSEMPHTTPTTLPAPKRKTTSPKKTPEKKSSLDSSLSSDYGAGYLYQRSFLESDCVSMVPRPSLPPVNLETAGLLGRELSPARKLPPNITQYVEKDNGKLVCPMCHLSYKRSSDLNRHMKRKHGCKLREYLENFSDTSFDKNLFLDSDAGLDGNDSLMDDDNEMSYSGNETEGTLSLIGDSMTDEQAMSMSESDSSPLSKENMKCKYCDYEAKWSSDLKRHQAVHSFEKRYKCNYCPKKYKYLGDLNVHIRRDHGKEPGQVKVVKVATFPTGKKNLPYKCNYCEYTSPWKSEVDRHSRLHKEVKTFQCSSCDYQTHWRGDIRRHVYQKHPEVLADGVALNDVITRNLDSPHGFVPSTAAGHDQSQEWTSCDDESSLSREGTPFNGITPMSHESTPEFNMNDYVTKTVSGHSPTPSPIKELGGGMYKCQYCGFVANAPSKMDSHIATHTNLKRYMCPLCGRRANWKWDIAKHIRSTHNDQVTQVIKLSKEEAESTIQSYMEANPIVRRDHHLNLTPDGDSVPLHADQFYKCSLCDFSAEKRISVSRHMRYMHYRAGQSGDILLVKRNPAEGEQATIVTSPAGNLDSPYPPSDYDSEVQIQDKNKSLNTSTVSPASSAVSTPSKFSHLVGDLGSQDASRPFMCATCGKRGATKGDVKKHYHYAHAEQEIRIVYLGDGSQSVYAAKNDVGFTEKLVKPADSSSVMPKPAVQTPSPTPAGIVAPSSGGSGGVKPSRQPKVVGYIKPYMCGLCGRRSNWRWDVSKHIRERHRGLEVQIIDMDEDEARATIQDYMDKTLPQLNKVSNSVPKKRRRDSLQRIEPAPIPFSPLTYYEQTPEKIEQSPQQISQQIYAPEQIPKQPEQNTEQMAMQIPVQQTFQQPTQQVVQQSVPQQLRTTEMPKGNFVSQLKQYKCSGCAYRSNYRSDITRHIPRRHGVHAHVMFLDKETAEATLADYSYRRAYEKARPYEPKKMKLASPTTSPSKTTLSGPLPKEAWAGLEKKIWKCSVCSYSNEVKVVVLKHLGKHNLKAYRCTLCNWTSNFRSAVQRHIQSQHPADTTALCKVSIKLIKEGPGVDQSGRSIMPDGMEQPGSDGAANVVPITGLQSMENPKSFMSTALFFCKICNFSSNWRSCVCRHLDRIHKRKDYIAMITKKIVRTSIPQQDPASTQDNSASSSPVKVPAPTDSTLMSAPKPVQTAPSRKKNFHCNICPYKTYKAKMLKFHMSCHKPQPGVKQVKCKYCPYYVTSNRLITQHLNLHLEDFQSPESVTSSYPTTPTKSRSPSHSRSPSGPKRHKCEKCPYMTNSKNDFLYHKQFHRPKPTADYKCEHCDYWVSHRRLIKQHMKVHEEGGYNSEPVITPAKSDYSESSYIYDTVEIAAIKQRIISSKITASISQSPQISPMKIAAGCSVGGRRSFLRKDGTYRKIHQCRHCPYMNIRLRNMKLHEMMHGKRSATHVLMKCPHCDYFVGSKGLLAHHMKVHQPNYGIEFIGQEKDKDRKDSQASEDSEVDGNIPIENKVDTLLEITRFKKFGCEKCPYASSKRSSFQRHVELHGSKQKCKCDFCDYCVPTMNLLNQHMRLHFEPNQNLLAAQSILNLQYLPEMPADVALASMMTNNDSKHPVSITHDHIDLYENQPEDFEPKKLYRCDRCPYANICRSNLLAHLRCHILKNEHACPYCDYTAGKPHVLMQHVKVHFSPLPELSEWITENGGAERLKEVKNPDLKEAIEVTKMYQAEKKLAKQKAAAENDVNGEDNGKESKDGDDKKEDLKMVPEKTEASISGEQKKTSDTSDIKAGQQAATNGVGAAENGTEQKESTKTEQTEEETTYVCQYCDQDFPTSDNLVRHEMKHLIGNSYEDLVSQLLKAAEMDTVKTELPGLNGNANGEGTSSKDDEHPENLPGTSGMSKATKTAVAMDTKSDSKNCDSKTVKPVAMETKSIGTGTEELEDMETD